MSVASRPDIFPAPSLADEIRSTLGAPGPDSSPFTGELSECYAVIAEQLDGAPDPDICADMMDRIVLLSGQDDEWRANLWATRLGGAR